MPSSTHIRKLRGSRKTRSYSLPGVSPKLHTKKTIEKPARITRRQLMPVLGLVQRVAAGGDATTAVDAAALVPVLQRAVAAAPAGQPSARVPYSVQMPDRAVHQVVGLRAVAALTGKAVSTIANALTKGRGVATFGAADEYGNPSEIVVRKAEEN